MSVQNKDLKEKSRRKAAELAAAKLKSFLTSDESDGEPRERTPKKKTKRKPVATPRKRDQGAAQPKVEEHQVLHLAEFFERAQTELASEGLQEDQKAKVTHGSDVRETLGEKQIELGSGSLTRSVAERGKAPDEGSDDSDPENRESTVPSASSPVEDRKFSVAVTVAGTAPGAATRLAESATTVEHAESDPASIAAAEEGNKEGETGLADQQLNSTEQNQRENPRPELPRVPLTALPPPVPRPDELSGNSSEGDEGMNSSNYDEDPSETERDESEMAERAIWQFEKPDRFGGTTKENATEWVDRFERIGRHNKWTKDDLARVIDIYLDGAAYKWLLGLESRSARPTNWEDVVTVVQEGGNAQQNTTHGLKSLFLRQFANENVKRLTERKLRARMQRKDEDLLL